MSNSTDQPSAHPHPHDHDPDHDHSHDRDHKPHGHSHEPHSHGTGLWGMMNTIFHLHGHSEQQLAGDPSLATEEGIRTIWWALGALGLTTLIQVVIVWMSGSVALLADTMHNLGDALNSIPLLIAFYLARRVATRRYTYGFGKAEDVASIFIVLSIAFSAGYIFWESFQKLINPTPFSSLGWVAAAAIVGFVGNEAMAMLQIRVGRKIGSDAMVADGLHARTDGLTSLAVLIAVIGAWLGYPIVDPIIGILIGITILFITRDAMTTMWYRLMDAIDPAIVDRVEQVASRVRGVQHVHDIRVRWIGHTLHADLHITVDEDLSTRASRQIAEAVRHTLVHALPQLASIDVIVDPCGHGGGIPALGAHHQQLASPAADPDSAG